MGEYSKRKSDGVEVKIGTCENMYYLRYEDRNKVEKLPHSLDPATCTGLRWRLPFPDEDGVGIGEYKDYKRGLRLWKYVEDPDNPQVCYRKIEVGFMPEGLIDYAPGVLQLTHKDSGMRVNMPCHHGSKIPTAPAEWQVFSGCGYALELTSVKNRPDGTLYPIVACRWCGYAWGFEWPEVLPYVQDAEMWRRLEKYAQQR